MQDEFSAKLREFRSRSGMSQNALAQRVNVDASYINRIEKSERIPTRNIILEIAEILLLQDHERDDLLLSAGYAPELAEKVDLTSPAFRLMAEIWTDEEADPEDQETRIIEILRRRRGSKGDMPS